MGLRPCSSRMRRNLRGMNGHAAITSSRSSRGEVERSRRRNADPGLKASAGYHLLGMTVTRSAARVPNRIHPPLLLRKRPIVVKQPRRFKKPRSRRQDARRAARHVERSKPRLVERASQGHQDFTIRWLLPGLHRPGRCVIMDNTSYGGQLASPRLRTIGGVYTCGRRQMEIQPRPLQIWRRLVPVSQGGHAS